MSNQKIVFDFNSAEELSKWKKVNDVVMGGISQSSLESIDLGIVRFSGILLPDNNGGFASYRASIRNNQNRGYKGATIKVKGDGKIYSLRFRANNNFDGYCYQAKFKSVVDKWIEIKIPFKDFTPTFRGKVLENKPMLKSENIIEAGILIADKQFGNFAIDIDWIKLY